MRITSVAGLFGRRPVALAAVLFAGALTAAACASSGPSATNAQGSGSAGGSGSGVTVMTASGPEGTYLVDKAGKALYLWVADTSSTSTCSGACAAAWPPLTTTGTPHAAGQAQQAALGTTKRDGGKLQVTYDGHPLYYFAGDSGPGDTAGQGSNGFGAKWWLVDTTGTAITNASSSGPGNGSGGY